jgi:hypothetical protein
MALGTIDAFAADPEQDYCTQLEVNCMLDDGRAVRVCSRAVRGDAAPKYERTAEATVRSDYGGPCGLWRLPWREQPQEVARPVPIGFSESTP